MLSVHTQVEKVAIGIDISNALFSFIEFKDIEYHTPTNNLIGMCVCIMIIKLYDARITHYIKFPFTFISSLSSFLLGILDVFIKVDAIVPMRRNGTDIEVYSRNVTLVNLEHCFLKTIEKTNYFIF